MWSFIYLLLLFLLYIQLVLYKIEFLFLIRNTEALYSIIYKNRGFLPNREQLLQHNVKNIKYFNE